MKSTSPIVEHFTDSASSYDERNQRLAPIADNMHFLIRILLKDIPDRARVLCVGVGTGAEILSLAAEYEEWTFVGVDPSIGMLDVCRERLREAGVLNRCELIHGYVQDVPKADKFDAALSILVAHFINRDERLSYYQSMCERLRPNGMLINTEISFDLASPEFPSMLKQWEAVQTTSASTSKSLASLTSQLRDMLTILPPAETEHLMKRSGIPIPVRFFQSLMICGWFGRIGNTLDKPQE